MEELSLDALELLMLLMDFKDTKSLKLHKSLANSVKLIEKKQNYWRSRLEYETGKQLDNWSINWAYIYKYFIQEYTESTGLKLNGSTGQMYTENKNPEDAISFAFSNIVEDSHEQENRINEMVMILEEFSDMIRDVNISTAVNDAFNRKNLLILKLLLDKFPDINLTNYYEKAVNRGNVKMVQFLLDNYSNRIPLDYLRGNWDTTKVILDSGKYPNDTLDIDLLINSGEGIFFLEKVFSHPNFDLHKFANRILKHLVYYKTFGKLIVSILNDPRVYPPPQHIQERILEFLIRYATYDDLDTLKSIIEHSKINITPFQHELLIVAAESDRQDVVEYLYNELGVRDPTGQALIYAQENKNVELKELLYI